VRAFRVGGAQARWSFLSVAVVSILSGFAGCTATIPRQPHTETAPPTEAIYVIAGGWHTELGLPVTAITGSLAALKPGFGGARYLVFGWGAHDYYMSQNPSIGDLLRAAASGPAVILVIPLESSPEAFFGASNVLALPVPPEGTQRLSQFLWDYLAVDTQGHPHSVSAGPYPRSVFFASAGTYNLSHTCNTWTAEALHAAGLPVNAAGVVFANQVLDQLPSILAGSSS